jgi:hypothetical protein
LCSILLVQRYLKGSAVAHTDMHWKEWPLIKIHYPKRPGSPQYVTHTKTEFLPDSLLFKQQILISIRYDFSVTRIQNVSFIIIVLTRAPSEIISDYPYTEKHAYIYCSWLPLSLSPIE